MTCREIADEFVVAIDWFDVTGAEKRQILCVLERYPFDSIIIDLLPLRYDPEQEWIQ